MNIKDLGYIDANIDLKKHQFITRIISKLSHNYLIYYKNQIIDATLAGRFRYKAESQRDYPAVGDFVVARIIPNENKAIIHELIPRKSALVRKTSISGGRKIKNGRIDGGITEEQVLAANIDNVFIVSGLDHDFNISRIERYITIAYNSGAKPIIILNKSDLCHDLSQTIQKVKAIALGIDIIAISATKEQNIDVIHSFLKPRTTSVFIGSSGVGKSTITNYLLGDNIIKTQEISKTTGKGKHTTTKAELFIHNNGYIIIDTPGLRELQLWGDESLLEQSFEDIYELSINCKFNDCSHNHEIGCAVKKAIKEGVITEERFESFLKQQGELQNLSKKQREYHKNIGRINKQKRLKSQN